MKLREMLSLSYPTMNVVVTDLLLFCAGGYIISVTTTLVWLFMPIMFFLSYQTRKYDNFGKSMMHWLPHRFYVFKVILRGDRDTIYGTLIQRFEWCEEFCNGTFTANMIKNSLNDFDSDYWYEVHFMIGSSNDATRYASAFGDHMETVTRKDIVDYNIIYQFS